MNGWRIRPNIRMEQQRGEACDDEKREQAQLGDGEKITEPVAAGDSAIIYSGKKANENNKNAGACNGFRDGREEFGQIDDEEVGDGGGGGDARQPGEPAVLNGEKAAEGNASIEIGAAGILELRRDFRHARGDDGDDRESHEKAEGAPCAEASGDQRGKTKNAGADHGVDHERGEAPAADGANEAGLGFRHADVRNFIDLLRCFLMIVEEIGASVAQLFVTDLLFRKGLISLGVLIDTDRQGCVHFSCLTETV
jgi:hypothetical protein